MMKHLRIFTFLFLLFCSAAVLHARKNFYQVQWQNPPAPSAKILSGKWDFNFRPYSTGSAETLWTDPAFQRDVTSGKQTAGARPTAVSVFCDEAGFAFYVFAGEPELEISFAAGKDAPTSMLECYVIPGTADSEKIEHYYQFIIDQKNNTIRDFPWLIDARGFQSMNGQFRPETAYLPNGYLTKMAFPWHFFWDRLPFLTQDSTIWRLGVMRWCPGGGQTWGGIVHEVSRMGYIHWPEFTPERKGAIMKLILRHAWIKFNALKTDLVPANYPADVSPYIRELPPVIQSFNFIPQYQEFCAAELNEMVADREAIGKGISEFDKLTPAEQESFYRINAPKLMNFEHDVRKAFRLWLEDKLITGESAK